MEEDAGGEVIITSLPSQLHIQLPAFGDSLM